MVPPITLQLVAPFVLVILMYYQPYYYAQKALLGTRHFMTPYL